MIYPPHMRFIGQPPEVYTEIELGLALIQADQSADCGAGGR